jgi:uncharacterized protein (DUF1499 family)
MAKAYKMKQSKTFCYYSCKVLLVETCLQHPQCVESQHILSKAQLKLIKFMQQDFDY